MSFSSPDFWTIVSSPADQDLDQRIDDASQDLDLLILASEYERSTEDGRREGVMYFSSGVAEVMKKFDLHTDPDAATLAWERCRGKKPS
jgi:hypothetical protein